MPRNIDKKPPVRKMLSHVYMAEFNRCIGDNIENVVRRLRARGYEVARIAHKTTILIRRPADVTLARFKSDLALQVQPRIGSVALSSTSGNLWLLDNKGNKPGIFNRLGMDEF